jgi:hypothetical protein
MAGKKWPPQLLLRLGIDRHTDAESPNFAAGLLDLRPRNVEVVAVFPIRRPPEATFGAAAIGIIVAFVTGRHTFRKWPKIRG